jgi:argininosuccinate lyase
MTMWSGRFSAGMDETLWNLSESFSFDHVLYVYDIAGSVAHVRGLNRAGLVTNEESIQLLAVLDTIKAEFDQGRFERRTSDEDIHMAIERRATELAGDVGAKIHTARSRNDQVATTLRLFTRDALTEVASSTLALLETMIELGSNNPTAVLPGYTHLQRAQAVLLSHHLNAHAVALTRDVERLLDARRRTNRSPLGAGALAGTSLPIDPSYTAELLSFDETFINSMDAVSDRDFVAESLFTLALIGVHLSRMGEELVLWTSSEFNFASLGDEFTTGSSMLPHKKNADVAELARGKSGRLVGNLTGLLVTLKGLPLSYNRDLQEDKEPLFDSVRTVLVVSAALRGAYGSLTFHDDVTQAAAADPLLVAIDVAEQLVREGVPFRRAHEMVGEWVGEAVRSGVTLANVVGRTDQGERFAPLFAEGSALANRTSAGSAGPTTASVQFQRLAERVTHLRQQLGNVAATIR